MNGGSKYTVYNKEDTITKVNLWIGKNVEEYTNITHGRKEYKWKRLILIRELWWVWYKIHRKWQIKNTEMEEIYQDDRMRTWNSVSYPNKHINFLCVKLTWKTQIVPLTSGTTLIKNSWKLAGRLLHNQDCQKNPQALGKKGIKAISSGPMPWNGTQEKGE